MFALQAMTPLCTMIKCQCHNRLPVAHHVLRRSRLTARHGLAVRNCAVRSTKMLGSARLELATLGYLTVVSHVMRPTR